VLRLSTAIEIALPMTAGRMDGGFRWLHRIPS
jgi:hypothetical protein